MKKQKLLKHNPQPHLEGKSETQRFEVRQWQKAGQLQIAPLFPRFQVHHEKTNHLLPNACSCTRSVIQSLELDECRVNVNAPFLMISENISRLWIYKKHTKYLRSSPTWSISHSILVSSMAHRPKGHSCLSSRLLFSRTICCERED